MVVAAVSSAVRHAVYGTQRTIEQTLSYKSSGLTEVDLADRRFVTGVSQCNRSWNQTRESSTQVSEGTVASFSEHFPVFVTSPSGVLVIGPLIPRDHGRRRGSGIGHHTNKQRLCNHYNYPHCYSWRGLTLHAELRRRSLPHRTRNSQYTCSHLVNTIQSPWSGEPLRLNKKLYT